MPYCLFPFCEKYCYVEVSICGCVELCCVEWGCVEWYYDIAPLELLSDVINNQDAIGPKKEEKKQGGRKGGGGGR